METFLKLWERIPLYPEYKQKGWTADKDTSVPFLPLSIAFGLFIFIIERWLDLRQLARYRNKNAKVPDPRISSDVFVKSLEYGKDKISFGIFKELVGFALGIAMLVYGYLPYVWDVSVSAYEGLLVLSPWFASFKGWAQTEEWTKTVIFVFMLALQNTLTDAPFNLYYTFVIEAKHGFKTESQTLPLFFKDIVLQLVLTLVFGSPCICVVISLARVGGPYYYVYVCAFLFAFSIFMMTIWPEYVAPLFNTFLPLKEGALKTKIEALACRDDVKFPLTKLFVVDGSKRSSHSNAYFYGFGKNKRIVLFDTLLKDVDKEGMFPAVAAQGGGKKGKGLDHDEILAVLGHEIGHWAMWHTIQGFVIGQLYTFALFATFAYVKNNSALFSAFGFAYETIGLTDPNPMFIALTLFTSTYWTPVDKVLTFLVNVNSRRNEFAADQYGAKLGYAKQLASGLIKLQIENKGNMVPDRLYSIYHFSHPPLVERLEPLEKAGKKST